MQIKKIKLLEWVHLFSLDSRSNTHLNSTGQMLIVGNWCWDDEWYSITVPSCPSINFMLDCINSLKVIFLLATVNY
jgi:hypothetical protein